LKDKKDKKFIQYKQSANGLTKMFFFLKFLSPILLHLTIRIALNTF